MQKRNAFSHLLFAELQKSGADSTRDVPDNPPHSALLWAFVLALTLVVAWLGRYVLLLLFAAIVGAILLTSVVDFVMARLRLGRKLAFALIVLVVFMVGSLGLWMAGPSIIEQFANLQADLPKAVQQSVERARGYGWGRWALLHLSSYSQLTGSVSYAVSRVGGIVLSAASLLAGLLIIAFLSLYLAAEPEFYLSGVRRATPLRHRATLDACALSATRVLRSWLLAQMLSMFAVGTLVTLGLWGLGVPLAGSLGIIAALMTFVPNVGPVLSALPAALFAFAESPTKGLLTVTLFALVHFLEGNLITPLIQRQIVRLPPALTLTMQLMLAVILGPLGVALAAPLTAAGLGVFQVLLPPDPSPPRIG